MRDRFDDLLPALLDGAAPANPGAHVFPRLSAAADRGTPAHPVLGIAPGARWDTKRWPVERFATLVAEHAAAGGRSRIFLGPQEEAWFTAGPLGPAAAAAGADVVRGASLPEVARGLAGCAAVVTNDSGLLHLAEAVGTPVVALYGPTVRAFGYFPVRPDSVALETDLECRPCSRNGRRPCHRGDLACLDRIAVPDVQAALAPLLAARPPGEA
jgi:heptosyltransferase-2